MKKSYSHPSIEYVVINTAKFIQTSPDIPRNSSDDTYTGAYRGAKTGTSFGSWSDDDNEENY